ncbi:MAG: hypothetical protein MI976_10590 [Pseudomonadales bacterium]|nr:hypothetical protein [Pseudomonadales bacterium]
MGEMISRAEAVSLLWRLKQASDRKSSSEIPYIHFNMLLVDPEYREEIIATVLNSNFQDLKDIAQRLDDASLDGRLIKDPSQVHVTRLTKRETQVSVAPPAQHIDHQIVRPQRRILPLVFGALGIVVLSFLAASGYLYFREISSFVNSEHLVSQDILQDTHWKAGDTYVLEKVIYVDAGANLTIDPGVTVKGKPGSALVVTRDSQIFSRGTRAQPIVFTSSAKKGERQPGDWGGVVLLGAAPVNVSDAHIEGIDVNNYRGAFGGVDSENSCGVMEYTRVEYAGYEVYANNELNGLTLGGCGSHTVVRNVQVHMALDDGVEVFGGTVDLQNILITAPGDDGLDWDMGWNGRVQFLIVQQHPDRGDNAFEGDSNKKRPDALPVSEPTIYNATLVGGFSENKSQRAMNLRRGTGGHFVNFLILGFSKESIDLRGDHTVANIEAGRLSFDSMIMFDIGEGGRSFFADESKEADDDDGGFSEKVYFSGLASVKLDVNPGFGLSVRDPYRPEFSPQGNTVAALFSSKPPQDEFWNEGANFLGAIPPKAKKTWLDGWTHFPGR